MQLPFATNAIARQYGLPEAYLRNLMVEPTPEGPILSEKAPAAAFGSEGTARLPRPGLVSSYTLGAGPVRGVFYNKGVASGRLLIVSGTEAYLSDGTDMGAIPGTDLARFAASPTQFVAVSAGVAYLSTRASVFVAIVNANLPNPVDVCYFGGYFVFPGIGSTRFYYSEVNDAANVQGLNFESVETTADPIVGVDVLGDEMVFFKTSTIEFWALSGDPDNPFQKSPGVRYQRGCASRDTICHLDNALFWLGDNRIVYRSGPVPDRISDHGVEAKLRQCTNSAACTAWATTFEGHDFYILNIFGVGTVAYDVSAKDWFDWSSYGRTGFRGRVAAAIDGTTYVGDDTSNVVWSLAQGVNFDGTDPLVRETSAFVPISSGHPRCDNLMLNSVRGVGNAVDPGSAPTVEMCYSDDAGRTFSHWRQASMGREGNYKTKAVWRRLGKMRSPGRLFRFRSADPVMSVFQSLVMNEDRP